MQKKRGPIGPLFLHTKNFYLGTEIDAEEVSEDAGVGAARLESWAGPRPSLMIARESGTNLVCQPLSLWNFCMAASVPASQ